MKKKKKSNLAKFELKFELDKTWAEAKKTIQYRPMKYAVK